MTQQSKIQSQAKNSRSHSQYPISKHKMETTILPASILLSQAKHRKENVPSSSRAKKTKKGGINVAPQRSRQGGTREHFVNISGSKSVARFPSVIAGLPSLGTRGEYTYIYIPGEKRERERRNEGEKTFSNIRRSLCISSKVRRLSRRRWMVVDVEGWRV